LTAREKREQMNSSADFLTLNDAQEYNTL